LQFLLLFKELLPFIAGELGTLIGMHIDLGFWLATPDGHQQGLQRQIDLGATLHRPTDHPPGKKINHVGQI
jgi:hypothetical protein